MLSHPYSSLAMYVFLLHGAAGHRKWQAGPRGSEQGTRALGQQPATSSGVAAAPCRTRAAWRRRPYNVCTNSWYLGDMIDSAEMCYLSIMAHDANLQI